MEAIATIIQQFAVQTQLLKVLSEFIHLEHFQSLQIKSETDIIFKPQHGFSNNAVGVIIKGSDQPAHMRSLISAFASRLIMATDRTSFGV